MKRIFFFLSLILFFDYFSFGQNNISGPIVQFPVSFDVSPPLRDMKPAKKHFWDRWRRENEEREVPNRIKYIPLNYSAPTDPALQVNPSGNKYQPLITNPILNFDGTANSSNSGRVTPPDPNGDVGPNHYVQIDNCMLQMFNKSGTSVYGPITTSTIWNGFNGNWSGHNDGDGVVLYDENADRWLISQFAYDCGSYPNYTNYQLVAISTSPDPTGSYYRYAFQFDYMPDYPKLSVWNDGYYLAVNRFNTNTGGSPFIGAAGCVLNRNKMLAGDASAEMIYFKTETLGGSGSGTGTDCYSMLPSDCDGIWAPAGTPNYFTYINDNTGSGASELRIWELHVDWATMTNSTFLFTTNLPVTVYTMLGSGTGVVPQQGTSNKLDGLGDRLMFRNQYHNFGSYQSFVTCHSVNIGSGVAGVRWYEYRKTGTTWSVYQQSTYNPGDGKSRWLGSVAMNVNGDIGLAYTVSSGSMYPSIYFTGRKASDPINTMTITEGIIQTGTASMTGATRWGDYATIDIDPSDNATFWTTNEYVGTYGGTWPWSTKIASFRWTNQPTVATMAATSITLTTATLNGTVNPLGLATTYHFEWGTTVSYGNNTTATSAGSGTATLSESANIIGLTTGTTYHFRIVAGNSDGTSYGNDLTFIPGAASVTTTAASVITTTTATAGGNVTTDGGSPVTARGTCWATTANPTISGSHTTDGSGTGVFTSSLTGLTANTTYHNRAYATNGVSTFYGSDLSFTTQCGVYILPFSESFSATTIPSCWSQVDNVGAGNIWQFGVITTPAPVPALTGNYAYLNSNADGTGVTENADLITPMLNLTGYINVTLQFNHDFRYRSPSSATLSYSINGGSTWTQIQQWTSSTANPAAFSQVINAVDNQSQVKFKWNYTGTHGYWWAVDDVSITGTGGTATLSVTPANQNVPATPAGSTTFAVTSNSSWTVVSDQTWCTVNPSGSGNGTITANYTVNILTTSRVANITTTVSGISPVVVTVTQAGATPTLTVTPANQNIPATPAGSTTFAVTSNSSWTVVSDQTWCTVTPSGSGNGTITANYTVNILTTSRVANITTTVSGISPVVVTITQAGAAPTLTVTPANQNVPATPAGSTTFAVTSNSSWTVVSDQTWCTVTPSGSGNGTITANYSENTLTTSRVANITTTVSGISPVVVTVTQAAATPYLSVTPANQNVTAPAGTTNFDVSSNSAWTVTSDQTWCSPTPSGNGDGTIVATYTENTSVSQRIATLTVLVSGIPPVMVIVTQSGTAPELEVTPSSQTVTAPAGSTNFTVTSNSDWIANSDVIWCSVTPSGTGSGALVAIYQANPSTAIRTANITVTVSGVAPVEVSVIQDGLVGVADHQAGTIRIIPNPATGLFRIVPGVSMKIQQIDILDLTGRILLSKKFTNDNDYQFDLSNEPQGCYFVKVRLNDEIQVRRLVISR
jgi:hypothetical protein